MNGIICEAIDKKRLLQFSYDELTRIVEPHLFGRKTTTGNDVLSGFLVGGYTESDNKPYWRYFTVENMESVVMLDETFMGSREDYNPNDNSMDVIYCRL